MRDASRRVRVDAKESNEQREGECARVNDVQEIGGFVRDGAGGARGSTRWRRRRVGLDSTASGG